MYVIITHTSFVFEVRNQFVRHLTPPYFFISIESPWSQIVVPTQSPLLIHFIQFYYAYSSGNSTTQKETTQKNDHESQLSCIHFA